MATKTLDPGPAQTEADAAQPRRKAAGPSKPTQEWPALARRCEELGITARQLQLVQSCIEDALEAIKAGRKGAQWEHKQRQKLRKRVVRAIEEAEAALEPSRDAVDTNDTATAVQLDSSTVGDDHIDVAFASDIFAAGTELRGMPAEQVRSDLVMFQRDMYLAPAMNQWRLYLRPTDLEDADHDVLLSSLDELSDSERVHFHAWRRQRGLFMLLDTFEQWEDWQETHQADFDTELLDHRVQAWSLNGMPAQPPMHTTTWAELLEHCCGPRQLGESDASGARIRDAEPASRAIAAATAIAAFGWADGRLLRWRRRRHMVHELQ